MEGGIMEHACTRRQLITGFGLTAMAVGVNHFSGTAICLASSKTGGDSSTGATFQLPPLPYSYDALEPHIDMKTMSIHHDKHHAGYVKGLNEALKQLAEARASNEFKLIKHWTRELAFHGSGHILHSLYWTNMSPVKTKPDGILLAMITKNFNGFDNFRLQFTSAAASVEGSGWAILAYQPHMKQLVILQAEKHQNLSIWGVYPLMVCDVWEHAYYLKYQNQRQDYIQNFFEIIDWDEVSTRLASVI